MTEVRTREEAIAAVDQALQLWATNTAGLLVQAQNAVRAAMSEVEGVARKRASEVAAVEALLAAADDDQGRQLQARLARARVASDKAIRARTQVKDVWSSVSQLNRTHVSTTTSQVLSARVQLSAMSRALDSYRSGGALLGSDGSGGRSTAPTSGDYLAGMGLAELDVDSADLDDNPILDDDPSQGRFGKGGLCRADYRWAVQTWADTVGPGVASGKGREDFAARDAQSNARPLRRTADVYDMFLGADSRIRADREPDGSLNIVNGRHRLLIAKELGIKTLPGQVR